jgi:NAD(P)-dependent dehydrogenase (short-subunit alcohol dehydrogenase family)
LRKVAFVTEGAVSVGREVSLALARTGFDLVIHHHGTATAARETARAVEALSRQALVVEGDARNEADVGEMVRRVKTRFGRMDVLVNCILADPADDVLPPPGGPRGWEGVDVRGSIPDTALMHALRAPFVTARAVAHLLADSGGSVVNVLAGEPEHPVAREAFAYLTRAMARAFASRVRVNAVAPVGPDPMASPPSDPVGYPAPPADVVRTVLFLLGSPHLTGEVVTTRPGGPG